MNRVIEEVTHYDDVVRDEEFPKLNEFLERTRAYLTSFSWCAGIQDCYLGIGIGGVIAVSLVHIKPANQNVDEWLWVIVGDIPPAYLVIDETQTAGRALEVYIQLMREWVERVLTGQPVEDCIPVNVEPTHDWAIDLQSRLDFLQEKVLPNT